MANPTFEDPTDPSTHTDISADFSDDGPPTTVQPRSTFTPSWRFPVTLAALLAVFVAGITWWSGPAEPIAPPVDPWATLRAEREQVAGISTCELRMVEQILRTEAQSAEWPRHLGNCVNNADFRSGLALVSNELQHVPEAYQAGQVMAHNPDCDIAAVNANASRVGKPSRGLLQVTWADDNDVDRTVALLDSHVDTKTIGATPLLVDRAHTIVEGLGLSAKEVATVQLALGSEMVMTHERATKNRSLALLRSYRGPDLYKKALGYAGFKDTDTQIDVCAVMAENPDGARHVATVYAYAWAFERAANGDFSPPPKDIVLTAEDIPGGIPALDVPPNPLLVSASTSDNTVLAQTAP